MNLSADGSSFGRYARHSTPFMYARAWANRMAGSGCMYARAGANRMAGSGYMFARAGANRNGALRGNRRGYHGRFLIQLFYLTSIYTIIMGIMNEWPSYT